MKRIAVFGHRGARGLAPENTIGGFAVARACGVTGVEFDVGLTADNVAVVHHDSRLNAAIARDAAGHYVGADAPLLRDLSLAELAAYDVGRLRAGSDYAARYPDQVPCDGAVIPSLTAGLAALRGLDLLIEVKTAPDRPADTATPAAMANAVIEALRAADAIERAVLFAFDWRVLREASVIEPTLRRCCLTEPDTVAQGGLWLDGVELSTFDGKIVQAVAATGAACWAPFHASLEEADVREAQSLGLLVLPWTVNAPEALDRMIGFGVDGIISDWPDRARLAVEHAGCQIAAPGFIAGVGRLVPEVGAPGGVEQKLP
ncbi:glycerophosphodiester phosphodiesterase [Acidiphilium sp. PA]|uniref:glycerophosphodiester phosphodiesterase n=1 Tax=Acidiphilium sp. PA TaxID=2871705 RepID=UPI002244A6F2|nr:glycerophosphodiester phosphodiesterase [Acidiphilium sp. PA]MCW8307254.1 glycerophosphodiester phosphodiesterase [Acidiphilium sp. PA]